MYNLEIVDEEAFMKWKEEVNDLHPGKGQALFQVRYFQSTFCLSYCDRVTRVTNQPTQPRSAGLFHKMRSYRGRWLWKVPSFFYGTGTALRLNF